MGRRLPRIAPALVLGWLLVGATPADGQYRAPEPPPRLQEPEPTPTDPRTDPDEALAAAASDARERRTGGWDPVLVVEGVYEENVGFTTPPGPDDYFGSIQASISRWRRTTRGEFRLTLEGAGYAYAEQDNRNRADGGVGLQMSHQLSQRVRGSLGGRFAYGHTDTEGLLIDSALVLPLVRTLAGDVGGELSWRLGERTTWSVAGGWQRIDFDSDILLDSELWSAGTTLARRISQREELSLQLRFWHVEDDRSTRRGPSALLGYTYRFAKSLTLSLGAGASSSEAVAGVELEPFRWDALVTAGLDVRVRDGHVSLGYEHGLRPTPGLGVTELTDLVRLSALLPIGRRLELIAAGSFGLRGESSDIDGRRRDGDAFVAGAIRLARRLRLVLGYRFRYRFSRIDDALELDGARNDRASVSLAWGPDSLIGIR